MVLVDDNFATIVAAVREGRVVFDNIRRFIMFSVTGNLAKAIVVAVPPLLGMVAMLKPIQILFSNLLTDGLLGMGMGVEAAERDTMQRPPYRPDEGVIGRGVAKHVGFLGPLIGIVMLALGSSLWSVRGICGLEGEARHRALLGWGTLMFAVIILQAAAVFVPSLGGFFATVPLGTADLALALGVSAFILVLMEAEKHWMR